MAETPIGSADVNVARTVAGLRDAKVDCLDLVPARIDVEYDSSDSRGMGMQ